MSANLHVIIGADDCLVEEAAKKIIGDGVGLEVIDSANSSNAELQMADLRKADDSFSTPPFLDPRKVTWWKNVHFLPGGKSSEEIKESLEAFATRLASMPLPDNQQFILSGPHLLKNSKLAKTLSSAAEIIIFSTGKPWEERQRAVGAVVEYAGELGLKFAAGVAEKFVSIVGTDTRSLRSEVAKLRDYLGKVRQVTAADVDAITSPGVHDEPEFWGVADGIGARDVKAAMTALRAFELENGFAVIMSGVIERCFRQLIDVKNGKAEGMNPWALRKNQGFAAKWSLLELRRARARFIELREKVVSGTTAGDVMVVTELLRAMRPVKSK